jgi:hypothetical protein
MTTDTKNRKEEPFHKLQSAFRQLFGKPEPVKLKVEVSEPDAARAENAK